MPSDSSDEIPGVFWSTQDPTKKIAGRLVLSGRRPRVVLTSPMTPGLEVKSRTTNPDGSVVTTIGAPNRQPDLTVHGEVLHTYARKITLFECRTVSRKSNFLFGSQIEEHTLEGEWSILGAHETGNFTIESCRFRFSEIDSWTARGSYLLEFANDGSSGKIAYERPEDLSADIGKGKGSAGVKTELLPPYWDLNGSGFTYRTRIYFEQLPGLTMPELMNRYIGPTSHLVTLCTSRDAAPISVHVKSSTGDRWCLVHHPAITGQQEDGRPPEPLLNLDDIGIQGIAQWIAIYQQISPIPALVANIAASEYPRTVENQVLELATSFEGLHRRLYPNARRMSKSQAKKLRRIARDSVPGEFSHLINEALFHLYDPTYHERLTCLLDEVTSVAPDIVGDKEEWLRQVKNARNGFAHQLPDAKTVETEALYALAQSLRWALTLLLLRLTGIEDTLLAHKIKEHSPYGNFLQYAKRVNRDVWPGASAV